MAHLKRIIPILIFTISALALTSCEKGETIQRITESEAVEIIESSLQENTGGLTSNLEDITKQLVAAAASGEICDTLYTNTVEENRQGSQVQVNYNSVQSYEMACNNFNIPQTASFSISTISTYSTPRLVSDDDAVFTGNATGIQPIEPKLNIAGSYSSDGTQSLNFMEQKDISSTFTIDLINIEVDKQSLTIESGSGTFAFTGATPNEEFSYSGSIAFNGNATAVLTINGTAYEVDWN